MMAVRSDCREVKAVTGAQGKEQKSLKFYVYECLGLLERSLGLFRFCTKVIDLIGHRNLGTFLSNMYSHSLAVLNTFVSQFLV